MKGVAQKPIEDMEAYRTSLKLSPTANVHTRLQALDAACAAADATGTAFDFGTWLATAVQDGLVLGAALEPLPSTPLEIPR
mgnify:CR=1 FL=1